MRISDWSSDVCSSDLVIDRVEVGLQDHVRLVDRLAALDRRPVEHQPVLQRILVDHAGARGPLLPLALGVGEAQVGPSDVAPLTPRDDITRSRSPRQCVLLALLTGSQRARGYYSHISALP